MTRRIFIFASAVLLAACATTQGPRRQRAETILSVDNRSVLDMNIYILRGSQRVRLGHAGGLRVTNLRIPVDLIFGVTPLRFMADPIGASRMPVTEEIMVAEGDEVLLMIPPN